MSTPTAATANGTRPLLAVRELEKRFRGAEEPVLEGLSLAVARGELVVLIGPSGCGKSTLLNIVAGLTEPTGGAVELAEPGLRSAYVFQRPRLLPWRTVLGNVRFGLEQLGARDADDRARRAIALVNLAGHEDKYPHQLSGGMQQRAALARGLAIEPGMFLLDEPFGALDALTRSYLQEELLALVRGTGATTLLVTHDIDEALLLGDRVAVMSSRPGAIKATVDVPFGFERTMDRIVAHPRYAEIRTALRSLLRPEVLTTAGGAAT